MLTRLAGKGDVRDIGSGNIGATNVLRTGSKRLAALTLLLDCLKATAAVLLAQALFGPEAGAVAGAGALIGHLYPVWLRFRGGKGVATLLGILIPLLPSRRSSMPLVWLLLLLTIRISSVAGMTAAISAPITAFIASLIATSQCCSVSRCWSCGSTARTSFACRKGTEPRIGRAKA